MAASIKFDVFEEIIVKNVDIRQAEEEEEDDDEEEEDGGPEARSGHRIVTDGINLYSIGGYNPDFWEVENDEYTYYPLFRELWKFNITTMCWKEVKTLGHFPVEMASHAALLQGSSLLVFGGTGIPFGEASTNQLHICNIHTRQWKHIECRGQFPIKVYGHSLAVVDHFLYVIGGTTGWEYNCDVHRLDLRTNVWEECGDAEANTVPNGRYRHELVCDGQRLYMLGGGRALRVYGFEKIPAFDLTTHKWEHITSIPDGKNGFPDARRCHSCVQLGQDAYICGGYSGENIYDCVWHLNLSTFQWRKLSAVLPQPVYFHSAAITPSGQMFIHGGVTRIDDERTSRIFSLWVKVPSLREISWHQLLHSFPHLPTLATDLLLSAGVPMDLVHRLES